MEPVKASRSSKGKLKRRSIFSRHMIQKLCRRGGAQRLSGNDNDGAPINVAQRSWFLGYYAVIPFLLFTLLMCIALVCCRVAHLRRRSRLDELRHTLIPLYRYDPSEDVGWEDSGEENLVEPLNAEGRLALLSAYGTRTE